MEVVFVASASPIVRDPTAAGAFYKDALGLMLEGSEGDYAFTGQLGGVLVPRTGRRWKSVREAT
jgi:catechol 2,3-dioxygenase-like lactoylglutathione lyase family enzyme